MLYPFTELKYTVMAGPGLLGGDSQKINSFLTLLETGPRLKQQQAMLCDDDVHILQRRGKLYSH